MKNLRIEEIHALNRKKSTIEAICVAALHIILIVLSIVLGALALRLSFWISAPISICLMTFIGTRFRAINNMSHECCHSAYAASRRVNDVFGFLFAIFELSSFQTIRTEHATHHLHLGDYKHDLDFRNLKHYEFHEKITRSSLKRHIKNAILCKHLREYLFAYIFDCTEPRWAKCLRACILVSLLVGLAHYPIPAALFLIAPFITTYQIHKYMIDYIDHGGLLYENVAIHKTRNFILKNALLRDIFFPRIDCYHLIHHLFPFLSVESLPSIHEFLMRSVPAYAAISHEADAQIKIWWRS